MEIVNAYYNWDDGDYSNRPNLFERLTACGSQQPLGTPTMTKITDPLGRPTMTGITDA